MQHTDQSQPAGVAGNIYQKELTARFQRALESTRRDVDAIAHGENPAADSCLDSYHEGESAHQIASKLADTLHHILEQPHGDDGPAETAIEDEFLDALALLDSALTDAITQDRPAEAAVLAD